MTTQQERQWPFSTVSKVKETSDIREAARLLDAGWKIIATAGGKNGIKLSLGYSGPAEPARNEKDAHCKEKESTAMQAANIILRQMKAEANVFESYYKTSPENGRSHMEIVWKHCRIMNDFARTIAELLR